MGVQAEVVEGGGGEGSHIFIGTVNHLGAHGNHPAIGP